MSLRFLEGFRARDSPDAAGIPVSPRLSLFVSSKDVREFENFARREKSVEETTDVNSE